MSGDLRYLLDLGLTIEEVAHRVGRTPLAITRELDKEQDDMPKTEPRDPEGVTNADLMIGWIYGTIKRDGLLTVEAWNQAVEAATAKADK
jgi:hypothetical protein